MRSTARLMAAGVLLVAFAASAPAGATTPPGAGAATKAPGAVSTNTAATTAIQVGSLLLRPCSVVPGAYCGSVRRPWDSAGQVTGTLRVGFAFVPARDTTQPVLGTLVPHEGGPGYSTTGSAASYAAMYGPLMDRRNFLVVDQRGTGLSGPIDCPALQNLTGPYAPAAATCARQLGAHADLYGSALSADDLAAVVGALGLGRIDLYGDSYGTFFAQVFAGRHPGMLRSLVLDSAYPTYGETAWYPTQGPAMLKAIDLVCARTPSCAAIGVPTSVLLERVLAQVRRSPYRGVGYDADGIVHRVVVDGPALVGLAFGATFGPAWYRELPGALRSALAGNREPLLRLVAEADYVSGNAGAPVAYSEGLDAAVSCHDYPQLYDMTAPPSRRRVEFEAAIRAQERTGPGVYAPFTVAEYLASGTEAQDWCLRWPVAAVAHPAGPPLPVGGHYPAVPTLVLSGEMDSITTAAEGALVTAQFPAARQVLVANSFHVTADGDSDLCAVFVLRAFIVDPRHGITPSVLACTTRVPPVRAVASYARSFTDATPATAGEGNAVGTAGRRAATAAALTVADLLDRWNNNSSGTGVGLYGGTWSYTGDPDVLFTLKAVRLNQDLAVSGTVRWGRYSHQVQVQLTVVQVDAAGVPVPGSVVGGTISGSWDSRATGAVAMLSGSLDRAALRVTLLAP